MASFPRGFVFHLAFIRKVKIGFLQQQIIFLKLRLLERRVNGAGSEGHSRDITGNW
jgi:hypothetical protein